MWKSAIAGFLFPGAVEREPEFSAEINVLSARGLLVVGCIQIALSLILLLAGWIMAPGSSTLLLRAKQAALIVALGIVNIAVSRTRGLWRYARLTALLSAFITAATLIWASLAAAAASTSPNDFIPGEVTLVLLVVITVVPLLPMQTLALGLSMLAAYLVLAKLAAQTFLEGLGPDRNYAIFMVMLAALATGITGVLYSNRRDNFLILHQTVEAGEALRQAQTRVVLTESSASISRLAAAIMHEMNTPLGALLSGIDTLVLTASKYSGASEDERRRLDAVQAEVSGSLRNSAARLQQLIARVRRFSILDDTTREDADVNALIEDAVALTGVTDGERAALRLQLQPLPEISCRPRQLATAFASLLSNAFNAVNGNGQVAVATRRGAAGMEIEITDNGRGIPPGQLAHIFDPAFQTSHGRMASGNWSMFNSRQIVREHGGDILITSSEGVGTRVTVTLPLPESEVAE